MPAHCLEACVIVLGLILLLLEAFLPKPRRRLIALTAIAGLGAVLVALFFVDRSPESSASLGAYYVVDPPALFFKGLALLATMLVLVMSLDYASVIRSYLQTDEAEPDAGLGEFFCLPLFTCAGLMWMASARDLVAIFVSLELVTISFYVLVAYMRRNIGSLEAGVKYLILGALSTGFFVYGVAWLYGLTGHTDLLRIAEALRPSETATVASSAGLVFALGLLLSGLGFKIAAVPFQIWVPDVYQGAPTPVTAYLSVASKAAGFIVTLRILEPFLQSPVARQAILVLLVLSAASILFGNLCAIPQTNVKRLLAYSSIAHAGFLLLAVASVRSNSGESGGITAGAAISFYLAAYLLMTLLVFLVVTLVRSRTGGEDLSAFDGLGKRSPFLAFALLVGMISLAGVPLTAGFLGKFYVFLLALEARYYTLIAIAALGAAAGFYYYFKILRSVYWERATDESPLSVPLLTRCAMTALIAAIFILGVYPQPVLSIFE